MSGPQSRPLSSPLKSSSSMSSPSRQSYASDAHGAKPQLKPSDSQSSSSTSGVKGSMQKPSLQPFSCCASSL